MSKLKSIIILTITGALLTIGFAGAMSESGLSIDADEPITNEQNKIAVKKKEAPVKTDNVKENLNEDKSQDKVEPQKDGTKTETKIESEQEPEIDKEQEIKQEPESKQEEQTKPEQKIEKKPEPKQEPKVEKKPEPKQEPKVEKKSMEQIVAEVKQGKWGSGEDRKSKLTKAGYDYSEVQSEVNKSTPKPTPKQVAPVSKTESSGETSSKSNANASNYRANRIYIGGSSMPMKATNMDSLQKVIDATTYTWISMGNYNPSDNRGTYFGIHSNTGGSVIYGLQKGHSFIVTDSSGNPHTYVVEKVYVQNKQEYFDDELRGDLNKEYVILQTSEPRVNGHRNGNRHVIAVKK